MTVPALSSPRRTWRQLLSVVGPGLVVMLADTDAGSVITAAQSGAQWGYRLLLLQALIVPVLIMVQELTVRLGLETGRGFGELIRDRFGRGWAWLAGLALAISCTGALVTELSGLAGIGQMFGLPAGPLLAVLGLLIFAMVCSGTYRSVERMAMLFGLGELAFLLVAWQARPVTADLWRQLVAPPPADPGYLYLLAANLGTSIMPWTVFYQQAALIDKGLRPGHLGLARFDTVFGALLCQTVTAAVMIAAAAALGGQGGASLDSVPQIANAFAAVLGDGIGRLAFSLGLGGGAIVATIVVCLTTAWAAGEVTGRRHSLASHPREAPWFYGAFALILVVAGGLVGSGLNLISLSVAVGVVNAVLLPAVLAGLFLLARVSLPRHRRLSGGYAIAVALVFATTGLVGLYAGITGSFAAVSP